MDVKVIEKNTHEYLKQEFLSFSIKVRTLCEKYKKIELDNWLDSQEVCFLMDISQRTLQTYRDTHKLSYSQIGHKFYYRYKDVEKLLQMNTKEI